MEVEVVPLTLQQRQKYLQRCGTRCPKCESRSIEGGSVNIDGGAASQGVWCNECRASWTDYYTLVNVALDETTIEETPPSKRNLMRICTELYAEGGATAVYDYAKRIKHKKWRKCVPCDAETPSYQGACLCCGSSYGR